MCPGYAWKMWRLFLTEHHAGPEDRVGEERFVSVPPTQRYERNLEEHQTKEIQTNDPKTYGLKEKKKRTQDTTKRPTTCLLHTQLQAHERKKKKKKPKMFPSRHWEEKTGNQAGAQR